MWLSRVWKALSDWIGSTFSLWWDHTQGSLLGDEIQKKASLSSALYHLKTSQLHGGPHQNKIQVKLSLNPYLYTINQMNAYFFESLRISVLLCSVISAIDRWHRDLSLDDIYKNITFNAWTFIRISPIMTMNARNYNSKKYTT